MSSASKAGMVAGRDRIIIAAVLGALIIAASLVAYIYTSRGVSSNSQTSSVSETTLAHVTLIKAGTGQSLPYRGGVPVCYDTPFNVSGIGTLSGGLRATGLINWYILSPSGEPPLSGTVVSGTMTQTLTAGSYFLEFCNQQKASLNLTITESFVVTPT